jgi:hypothetical protein
MAEESLMVVPSTLQTASVLPPARRRAADTRQPELFTPVQPPEVQLSAPTPPWMSALFASDIYAAQRRLAGRGAPPDEQVQLLLLALTTRGGKLSRTGLAQALSAPTLRVGGLVSAARRLLNLDQAQVLVLDGDEVTLDERMLRVQFDLGNVP